MKTNSKISYNYLNPLKTLRTCRIQHYSTLESNVYMRRIYK